MKKLILLALVIASVACTNPEDSANNNTDSSRNANTEGTISNSPPGGAEGNNSGARGMDQSKDPTTDSVRSSKDSVH